MKYLVIDLEMCKVPKHYRNPNYKYANEIIQGGAVLLDENYKSIGTISQYVHPKFGVIDHFISNLTGINNRNVKNAPLIGKVLKDMITWLSDREYKVIAWSKNDLSQLEHEIKSKNIDDPEIAEFMNPARWIDYQNIFAKRYEFSRPVGLEEALMLCDLNPDGRFHDGLCDALNTAKLIKKLKLNLEFQIQSYEKEKMISAEPLSFNLGDYIKSFRNSNNLSQITNDAV